MIASAYFFATRESRNVLRAKREVADMLKDPESAKFRNIREYYPNVVCGEVNSKNGWGGYAGYKPFLYHGGKGFIKLEPSEDEVAIECSKSAEELQGAIDKLEELSRK